MPCSPITASPPVGPSLPPNIFGSPFSPGPGSNPFPIPSGFPEDLVDLYEELFMVYPVGIIKPLLRESYDRSLLDGISYLIDQVLPFLMIYKLFLPMLNIIICIIEILCSIPNPFKMIAKIRQLFRVRSPFR